MSITLHDGDIPADLNFGPSIAIDTEAMGLQNCRDRLCLVQLSSGDGTAHLVQFKPGEYDAPNLKTLLRNPNILKIFHFARFDIALLKYYLDVECTPLYCTKIASKLIRTYTDRHGLRELCRHLLNVEINKQQQTSDWGAPTLDEDQLSYAASDVLYLHRLKEELDKMLEREGRVEFAQKCYDFLMTRANLDIAGWNNIDIFEH